MKIVILINSLEVGGAEKLVSDTIPHLQNLGHKIKLIILKNSENSPIYIDLKKNNVVEIVSLTNGWLYNPFLIFKIRKELNGYDLMHMHLFPSFYLGVISGVIYSKNIKLVYTEHSTNNRRRKNYFFRFFDRVFYKKLDKIITISKDVDKNLKDHLGFTNEKFQLIENGINLEKFLYATPYDSQKFFNNDSVLIIQVSSFRYPKDQITLLKAIKLLDDKFKLLLVGDGPTQGQVKKEAQLLNVSDRVKFLGIRNDIPNLLKTSNIIVLSSAYEGLSLSSIEGMSVNKPFVATNVPGLREIVKGSGLLFDYQDEKQLSKIIKNLYDDEKFYNSIAQKCFQKSQEFDIKLMIGKYNQIYHEV